MAGRTLPSIGLDEVVGQGIGEFLTDESRSQLLEMIFELGLLSGGGRGQGLCHLITLPSFASI